MKEHPILFSGPMVRAILDCRKTQTRRLAKMNSSECPVPYLPGDRLWVRETWNLADPDDEETSLPGDVYGPYAPFTGSQAGKEIHWRAIYRADPASTATHPKYGKALWRPSIHMPRWACRLVLEIDGLRLHQLQEMTEEDAIAEGCQDIKSFMNLWNKTYQKLAKRWSANPWVWAIKFHIVERK